MELYTKTLHALSYLKSQTKVNTLSKRSGVSLGALKSYIGGHRNPTEYKRRLLNDTIKEILKETSEML